MSDDKPLGGKAYGSIPHLPGSKRGPADHGMSERQARILTDKPRKGDTIIVQEKIDGSCVSIAKIDGEVVPLIRAGYRAKTSHRKQHQLFANWVYSDYGRWDGLLNEGERLCGEWCAQAHGTRYDWSGCEPFWAFDLARGGERALYSECSRRFSIHRVPWVVQWAPVIAYGPCAFSVDLAMEVLGQHGTTGRALEPVEGCVWRVEREGRVDFLAKYVRPEHETGKYLEKETNGGPVWNLGVDGV